MRKTRFKNDKLTRSTLLTIRRHLDTQKEQVPLLYVGIEIEDTALLFVGSASGVELREEVPYSHARDPEKSVSPKVRFRRLQEPSERQQHIIDLYLSWCEQRWKDGDTKFEYRNHFYKEQ